MELNAPIPLGKRQIFAEDSSMSPERDSRKLGQLWKQIAALQSQIVGQQQALQKLTQIISSQRRKPLGGYMPQTQIAQTFPFKIYTVPNSTATDAQKALFTAQGVDINNFTLQISAGLVGVRPYINTSAYSTGEYYPPADNHFNGNYEIVLPGYWGTEDLRGLENDNSPDSAAAGTCIILNDATPTLLFGVPLGSPAGTAAISCDQIALNQNQENGLTVLPGYRAATFWIEIVDDFALGLYLNLWGCMYATQAASERNPQVIPQGANIIPIGSIEYSPAGAGFAAATTIFQAQSINLTNRFPPGFSANRGRWVELYAALPSGATTLNWYPGDIVVDDTPANSDTNGFFVVWQKTGGMGIFTVGQTPSVVSGWQQVGSSDA